MYRMMREALERPKQSRSLLGTQGLLVPLPAVQNLLNLTERVRQPKTFSRSKGEACWAVCSAGG